MAIPQKAGGATLSRPIFLKQTRFDMNNLANHGTLFIKNAVM
jgi:hypothetical protein